MLFQILKKDMLKRKGINIILFIFITLSTIFLASSLNNILVVSTGIDYYMDYANISDISLITNSSLEKDQISTWLETGREDGNVSNYNYEELLSITDKFIHIKSGDNQGKTIDMSGASLYLGKLGGISNVAYDLNGESFQLAAGEIAIPITIADKNNLNVGDTLDIDYNGEIKTYKLTVLTKDATFGNMMVGMSRFLISNQDYDGYTNMSKLGLFNINTTDVDRLNQLISTQDFKTVIQTITLDMYQLVYAFDMIMAALLILIGICLILIALLVLRFTLVFTMEEQYQEIGILKAIGLRNLSIKKLYLIKYLTIVVVGACIGLIASVPISTLMIKNVSYNMIMENSQHNIWVNILSAVSIVVLVLLFCYLCTKKLNKVSAISAIRNGDTGESFKKYHGINLSSKSRMKVPFYLGLNDIASHLSRYLVLIITFCISFLLITIPLNTLNTMKSDEMISKFNLDTSSAAYLRGIEGAGEENYNSVAQIKNKLEAMDKQLQDKGYDANFKAMVIYFLKFNDFDSDETKNIMTLQLIGKNIDFLEYSKGKAPILENELAVSEDILKQFNWQIGDTVCANFNNQERQFIITGTYSDYMQLGQSARLNPVIEAGNEAVFDYWAVMMDMPTDQSEKAVVKEMSAVFPEYEWTTSQDLVNQNIGGIQDALAQLVLPMTIMLCVVIMLITLLMEKLFIIREKGEIAMLKSIGFKYRTIRDWQIVRMILVALTSMIISIPLSMLSNQFILKPIFKIMGANVNIQINALQVYFIYPGILLLGIILATMLTARGIKKIDIREINNIE